MFIPSLDPTFGLEKSLKAAVGYLGSVLVENASTGDVQALIAETGSTFYWARASSMDDAIALWDSGVYKVVFPAEQYKEFQEELKSIPEDRLAIEGSFSALSLLESLPVKPSVYIVQSSLSDAINTTSLHDFANSIRKDLLAQGGERRVVVQTVDQISVDVIAQLHKLKLDVLVSAKQLTTSLDEEEGKLNIGKAFLATATTDRPDGLFTTIVVDERNSALGLVYSSTQSVSESLRTGQGVYQSRKHGLWYKGAISGATQTLVRIDYDCDGDTLRFVVRQHGAGMIWITAFGRFRCG